MRTALTAHMLIAHTLGTADTGRSIRLCPAGEPINHKLLVGTITLLLLSSDISCEVTRGHLVYTLVGDFLRR